MTQLDPYDWNDKKALVVRRVDPIAVYVNATGDIVIRQQLAEMPGDAVVTIPIQYAYTVIEGIQRQLKSPFVAPLAAASKG